MNYYLATQVHDLLNSSSAGQVSHSPGSLLLSLEVSLDEDVDERHETASINDHLDLLMVSSSDVGDGPGTLLISSTLSIVINFSWEIQKKIETRSEC